NRLLILDSSDDSPSATLSHSRAPAMQRAVELARQVAGTDAPVLVSGETGTGKEVLARAIHEWSGRAKGPFVKINCAALPESLIESELFGHVRGAFSGAERDRPGRFQMADGGTLLLDEIGDMPLAAQAKLLRVLQEGTFEPVGSDATVRVDVRLIAATHVDLKAAIDAARFREDLFYRIGLFPIALPPLRERVADVVGIAERFLEGLARRSGRGPWQLGEEARRRLVDHAWPGNVRELINALERATILVPRGVIEGELAVGPAPRSSPSARGGASPGPESLTVREHGEQVVRDVGDAWPTLEELETNYLRQVLDHTGGKVYGQDGAARIVGMKPTTLQSRLEKRGLKGPSGRRKGG
ncbi:MAG: sigma 54-interacting transcriptional regulator, partial [Myxococcota bacterium]